MHDRRSSLAVALALAASGAVLFADRGSAQETYPNKPVKIVVGMPAGSFTDLSARLIGDGLRQELKESFVIENRPGAATNIATQNVARSPKDGYTLLLSTNSNAMNVSLFKDLPFDVTKDFQPVAMIASTAFILAVTPSLPVSNLKELIAYAKANPGTLNFASTGSGTANHLAVEMLAKQADIKVATVFYKGSMEGHRRCDRRPYSRDVRAGVDRHAAGPGRQAQGHCRDRRRPHVAGAGFADDVGGRPARLRGDHVEWPVRSGGNAAARSWTSSPRRRPRRSPPRTADEDQDQWRRPDRHGARRSSADYLKKDISRWSDAIQAAGIKPQ